MRWLSLVLTWIRRLSGRSAFSREWHAAIERASWQDELPEFVRWQGQKVERSKES